VTVQDIVSQLGLRVLSGGEPDREITGGYASDLLSCVMARAERGHIWVTLQAHPNVVAVASLLDLAAVIITEGVAPDQETVDRALQNNVALLGTPQTTFAVVAQLGGMGVAGA
jgi:hypothetical protein